MTAVENVERRGARSQYKAGQLLVAQDAQPLLRPLCITSGVALGVQDAPRAWRVNSDPFAICRLARPNRLNSCALFLARPL